MKFKDLEIGKLFTWWDHDQHLTGVKASNFQAFSFGSLLLVGVHANKDVKEPEPLDETLQYKVGHDGRGFLCSPISGGKVLAQRILLLTGEIMSEEQFKKSVSTRNTGGDGEYFEQVYIMWELLEKKLHDLNTLAQTVKMLLEDGVESGASDNNIMLTSVFIKGQPLTE
jgi:hypothetical protein